MGIDDKILESAFRGGNFVSIGGVMIEIDDFVKIWNNESLVSLDRFKEGGDLTFLPELHTSELMLLGADKAHIPRHGMNDVADNFVGIAINAARLKKYFEIRGMVIRYKEANRDKSILELDRVLAKINPEIRYSDISQFLATLSSPTVEDADAVSDSIKELRQGLVETHYPNEINAKSISSQVTDTRLKLISTILGIKESNLRGVSTFLLEKAVFGHLPNLDDYMGLTALDNIGSYKIATIRHYIHFLLMGGGMAGMIFGIHDLNEEVFTNSIYPMMIGLFMLYLYNPNLKAVTESRKNSVKKYNKMYKKVAAKIAELEKTPFGKLQILIIREIVNDIYSKCVNSQNVEALIQFRDFVMETEDRLPLFQTWCNQQKTSADFDNFESFQKVLDEFKILVDVPDQLDRELESLAGLSETEVSTSKDPRIVTQAQKL